MPPGPRFSIVLPVYNGQDTICRAIDSILQQTYPAYEVVVVDDGSTDDTAVIIKKYGSGVRYLYQTNQGVSAARNYGADAARGEWLAFLDADDIFLCDRLKLHADWIQRDEAIDFYVGNFEYRDINGCQLRNSMESTEIGARILYKAQGSKEAVLEGEDIGGFVEEQFSDVRCLSVPKHMFKQVGGYPEHIMIGEDVYLIARLCAASVRIGVICVPIAAYIIHERGIIRSDVLRAQAQSVAAFLELRDELRIASHPVRVGLEGLVRRSRMDLAVTLLRRGQRLEAMRTIIPNLIEKPGLKSMKDLLSVIIGLRQN